MISKLLDFFFLNMGVSKLITSYLKSHPEIWEANKGCVKLRLGSIEILGDMVFMNHEEIPLGVFPARRIKRAVKKFVRIRYGV
jgi:hypothetical protein